tara:strand:- start:726 stop:1334 length:609 start_codon:yes stop_codon:yes gene_type:complete
MKVNEHTLERLALYIGWHQSMLIKYYPSHANINAGLAFLRSNFHSSHDQLIKAGLFESLYKHVGASSAIVNEYSARGLLINYDPELYEDYFRLIGAYTAQKILVQSSNQVLVAEANKDLDLTSAFYILFNISADDLQDWKWVGGRYPWKYQDQIDSIKKQTMECILASRTFFHALQPFHQFYDLPQGRPNLDLDTTSLIKNG